ncbi:MAG TPA: ATP-binding protein [Candidatus Omnitrophota bacterium]|nr:ATP-binding protein [Candidatus Omnitrophota bacterium]
MSEHSFCVLIVDDAEADLLFIKRLIEDGFRGELESRVETARSFEEALPRIFRQKYDVILLDYRLGAKNGLELLEEIRRSGVQTPAIFLTVQADLNLVVKAMRAGAADYLVKGAFSPELLCQAIRYAIRLGEKDREKKKVEEILRQNEDRLKKIFETIRVGIILGEGIGGFEIFNNGMEDLTGYSMLEANACDNFLEQICFADPDRQKLLEVFRAAGEKGGTQEAEIRMRNKNGALRDAGVSVSRVLHGNREMFLAVFHDLTKRKEMESKLRQAISRGLLGEQKLVQTLFELRKAHEDLKATQSQLVQAEKWESVGRLASGVAHEVKNPLAILMQAMECLERLLPQNDPDVRSVMETMSQSIQRAEGIVKGMLDFASLSSVSMTEQNLSALIENILILLKPEFEHYAIQIEKDLSERDIILMADKTRMEQVFINLFTNAVNSMTQGGQLRVKTFVEQYPGTADDKIFVIIEDSGSGIPEDIISKVFEPFFTTRYDKGGSGLGLSIVKSIIETHGGRVMIENRKEGGARVLISFPVKSGTEGK